MYVSLTDSVDFCVNRLSAAVLHDLHLIHTDLKPENILLVHNDYKVTHVPIPGKVSDVLTVVLMAYLMFVNSVTHKERNGYYTPQTYV
jgi:serine/threonine protein kinase